MSVVFYNHVHKKLGIEKRVDVIVPLKIARRITLFAKELRQRRKG